MKQSAAKTLGVAALGAAFAAVGAGAANAAPAVPDAGQALGAVSHTPPAQNLSKALPGAGETLEEGRSTVGATQPAAKKLLNSGPSKQVKGLIGGLPVNVALPAQGVGLG